MSSLIREDLALYGVPKLDFHATLGGGRYSFYLEPGRSIVPSISEGAMPDDWTSSSSGVSEDTEGDSDGGPEGGTQVGYNPLGTRHELDQGQELLQEDRIAGGGAVGTRQRHPGPAKRPRLALPSHPGWQARAGNSAGVSRDICEVLPRIPTTTPDYQTGSAKGEEGGPILGNHGVGEDKDGPRPLRA